MERKTFWTIGPRTRQDILKGKVIRKLKSGGDNFEDYWTDADKSSSVSKSLIYSSESPKEIPNVRSSNLLNASQVTKICYSPLKSKASFKSKAAQSSVKSKTIRSLQKPKAVPSSLKSRECKNVLTIGPRTQQDILKGKVIRKCKDGGDNFEDYWSDADDKNSSVSESSIHSSELSEDMPNVQSSNSFNSSHVRKTSSLMKSKAVKSKAIHSLQKSKTVPSSLKKMKHKKFLTIGPRTRQDIFKGKVIRKCKDGGDNFEDYWSDANDKSSSASESSNHSSELSEKIPNLQSSKFLNSSHVIKTPPSKSKAFKSSLNCKSVYSQLADSCHRLQTSEGQKTRSSSIMNENNFVSKSVNSKNSVYNFSGINYKRTNEKHKKLERNRSKQKAIRSNSDSILDEGNIEVDNLSLSWSKTVFHDNCTNVKKTAKNKRKNESSKSDSMLYRDSVEIDRLSLSSSKTSEFFFHNNPANVKKTAKNQKKNKNSVQYTTDSYQQQTDRQETSENTRNSFMLEENNKSKQRARMSKSDFMLDKDSVEIDSFNLSQLKTAKKQRKNKTNVQSTIVSSQQQTKRQETSKNMRNSFILEENNSVDASNSSSENNPVDASNNCSGNSPVDVSNNFSENNSVDASNNFSENNPVDSSNNSSENNPIEALNNSSRNLVSEINKKKATKQLKSIEDKNHSKAQASKKSNLSKNNVNRDNEESIHIGVRRSTRERYPPLARWRNERLCYGFRNGDIEIFGIDKGTKEDADFLQSLYKKRNPKQKIQKPKQIEILDIIDNKKKRVHLHKKFPLVSYDPPRETDENPSPTFLIKRMFETRKNSFGYVLIDVGKSKQEQYLPEEDLLLTAIEGSVEVHLHGEVSILERKDMFIVPRGTAYFIKNISKRKALLSYVVGRFKFLDDL